MSNSPPLAGVRILDLTRLLPGGYATQMLADLGADVVKIEEPGVGDYSRSIPPLVKGVGEAFLAVNRNKRSVALNLKAPEGRDALLRLAERADVLVEGFRPGVMTRLGLDAATLRERNPRLIVCAISGYGQTGPYAQRAGHDLNYLGYAGVLAHLRRAGQPPTVPGMQFADIAGGGLMAVVGILAALAGRAATGAGREVDVSMLDGSLALAPLLASGVLNGQPEPAAGASLLGGGWPCYNVYACADGRYVTLAAVERKFWAAFCRAVERNDLIPMHMPTSAADREAVERELTAIFLTRTRDEWVAWLGDADVCLGPVNTLAEALDDPQINARDMKLPTRYGDEPGLGLRATPLLSACDVDARRGYPLLGEHTREVFTEAGMSQPEIDALFAVGAAAE